MARRTLLLIASILVAALGTSLIWLYVQGADARAASTESQVQVLVATNTVAAGSPASAVATQQKLMPQSLVAGLGLVSPTAKLEGYTRTAVVPGLPLLKAQFVSDPPSATPAVDLQPGQVAMQVTLPDPQRLVGLLQPGSRIRVYSTLTDTKTNVKSVGVLFNTVTVLLAGPAAPAPAPAPGTAAAPNAAGGATTVPQAIVTLALDNDQAKLLVLAQSAAGGSGSLYFGLLGPNVPKDDKTTVKTIQPGVK